jgi:aspartate aminotransferase-like enzyme
MIADFGMENLWRRHERHAKATQESLKALGLELFSKSPCNVMTPFIVPEGVDGKGMHKYMRDELGVTMAGGQSQLEGKIIRVGHMGYHNDFDVLIAISSVEKALLRFGYKIEPGKGVGTAQKILIEEAE